MLPQFEPRRELLNPQFEGYKLNFTPSPRLQSIPLPEHATQSRSGIDARGFQEVASRVRHNHLAVGNDSVLYIAEDGSVVLVRMKEERLDSDDRQEDISLHVVFKLPETVSGAARVRAEYPAATHLLQNIWLVSDGHGIAYLLHIDDGGSTASILASWELQKEDGAGTATPFQLHCATVISPGLAIAVLSSAFADESYSSTVKMRPVFDIWAVHIPIPVRPSIPPGFCSSPRQFEVVWRRRGNHIPYFVTYVPARNSHLILGGSSYDDISSPAVEPYEPTWDELAPVPRPGEKFDPATAMAPLYSWTQSNDAVTVAFSLPTATPKSSIQVTFDKGTLSLFVGSPPLAQPLYDSVQLWDMIHPATSLWTWESGSTTCAGLLTLHLDKAHPGTRWSHVFAQGYPGYDIAETLDPSELVGIRETLDKFTLQEGSDKLRHSIPSLAKGERDIEVDSSVGYSVLLTWVANDGSSGAAYDAPAVLLSFPFPGVQNALSLVIKNDIDGLLYTYEDAKWKHTATYPALGFVLASKQDTRFTFHISSRAVLAFESGTHNNGGGNVYIYRECVLGEKWAKQGIFQQPADAGALLGVGAITSQKNGRLVVFCLSERDLMVCYDLI